MSTNKHNVRQVLVFLNAFTERLTAKTALVSTVEFLHTGKTSIVRRLMSETNDFEEHHIPTVEELYQMEYKMRSMDVTFLIDLLDTSGSYPFPGE